MIDCCDRERFEESRSELEVCVCKCELSLNHVFWAILSAVDASFCNMYELLLSVCVFHRV